MDSVKFMQRHLAKCEEDGDCLLYMGALDQYGAPRVDGEPLRRRVWRMREGPIPKGMMVGVSCGRANCLEHLALRTRAENMKINMSRPDTLARMAVRSRARQRETGKLSFAKVAEIRVRAANETQYALAAEFGVAQSLISKVVNKRAWWDERCPFAGLAA